MNNTNIKESLEELSIEKLVDLAHKVLLETIAAKKTISFWVMSQIQRKENLDEDILWKTAKLIVDISVNSYNLPSAIKTEDKKLLIFELSCLHDFVSNDDSIREFERICKNNQLSYQLSSELKKLVNLKELET